MFLENVLSAFIKPQTHISISFNTLILNGTYIWIDSISEETVFLDVDAIFIQAKPEQTSLTAGFIRVGIRGKTACSSLHLQCSKVDGLFTRLVSERRWKPKLVMNIEIP